MAREYANVLAAAGINIKVLGFYSTLSALQSAVPYPAIGDFYGIGISPSIYAYVWNGNQWMKGHLLDPMVNSVNGKTGAINLTAPDVGAAPESHNHSASNITSGTLPISRGGTGGTTASAARSALGITPENIGAATVNAVNTAQSTANTAISNAATAQSTADGKANASHTHAASDVTSGTLPIIRGGTGQITAAGIRNALGLGNTTSALPVANGGTGATNAAAARSNLGAASAAAVTAAQSTADTALTNAASAQTTANTALANTQTLNTGKLDTGGNGSNVTAAFSQATTKANIATGEKLSVIFGKLMKWFGDFGAAAWMGTGTTSNTVALGNHTHTAAAVGAVPTSRTVNGKALSADVTLTAPDVGARAGDWLPSLAQVGGVRPNLLDNAHRTINQMGLTTISTNGYSPDRWAGWFAANAQGHVDLVPDGWQITKTAGDYITLGQPIELSLWNSLVGKVVTLSALVGSDLFSATFTVTNTYQSAHILYGIDLGLGSNGTNGFIQCALFSNITTDVIKHIKLELGEGQTLAHQDANGNWVLNDPPPNLQEGLAKCQRFYQVFNGYYAVGAVEDDGLHIGINFPIPMRVTPTFQKIGTLNIQLAGANGNGYYTDVTPTFRWGSERSITLLFANPDASKYTLYRPVAMRIDGKLSFSAEL